MESPANWLQAGTTASLAKIQEDHDAGRNDILEGIEYSIVFIVTYQWILVGFTVLCSLWYYTQVVRRARSRHASMFTSKYEAERIPKEHHNGESSPLLRHDDPSRPSVLQLLLLRIRACLMYQPTFHPEAQGGDTSLLVLVLFGINIFYAVYRVPFTVRLIFVLADRAGLLFAANLPWLYLLSAKNQPFRLLTGTSYESLNILHRGLGKWLAVLSVFHTVGMVIVWYTFLLPQGLDLWWFLGRNIIWIGLLAFTSYQVLAITSHVLFRQWWYEMFLGIHIFAQAAGLVLLFLHHSRLRTYVGIALAIFVVDRLVYRLAMKTRTFAADLTVLEDGNTVMVSSSWPLLRSRWSSTTWLFGRRDLRYGWSATDHVFLTVPELGRKHALQAHPFTIASAAPDMSSEHAWFNLIIRVRNGFTTDLLRYAEEHRTTKIRLDGPYGSAHALDMLQHRDSAIVIAGGSGIAVAYPLLWKLLHCTSGKSDSDCISPRACLIWIVHEVSHVDWLGLERLHELEGMGLRVIIPPATSKVGRPDIPSLLQDNMRDLGGKNMGVIVSGPDAMNRAVRNACASMAWNGIDIKVAVEVFDW